MLQKLRAERSGEHQNAFGFLRLVLASLVIVSHTPELVDGDRHRELLTRAFGTMSFGELAVNGFFIVSGYLITASYLKSPHPKAYLRKRVARIYPAFAVSSLICLLVVAPVAGGVLDGRTVASAIGRIAILAQPKVEQVFYGTPNPLLNGAVWTIKFEFLCYLLVLGLGVTDLLRSWKVALFLSAAPLLILAIAPGHAQGLLIKILHLDYISSGNAPELLRLSGMFFAGATFYLLRHKITASKAAALLALVLTVSPISASQCLVPT